jgi:hypothetical protein
VTLAKPPENHTLNRRPLKSGLILSNQNILNDTSKQAEVKTGVSMTAEFQPDASHQRPERSEP